MLAVKLPAMLLFFFVLFIGDAAFAQPGGPVHSLTAGVDEGKNIVKVMWDPQEGVAEYAVERWEARGTSHWHFEINSSMRSEDTVLKVGKLELTPVVFSHPANSGRRIELYDESVKPSHTYFYRVNRGRVEAVETKASAVIPLSESQKKEIIDRQAAEAGQQSPRDDQGDPKTWKDRAREQEKKADYPERMAADLIMAFPKWLVEVIGLHDPLELVFGVELEGTGRPAGDRPAQKSIWYTFNEREFAVVSGFYSSSKDAAPVFMAVGVVVAGVLVLFRSAMPDALRSAKGYAMGILLCASLIKLGPYLLGFFFEINRAVVVLCQGVIAGDIRQSMLDTIYNGETRSLGSAIVALIACLSIGVINFQFAMRKLFIAILVGILPIVLINAIYPGRRSALAAWVREFASYVFMPAGFAIGLAFFIRFLHDGDFWVTLVCLLTLPAINGLLRGVMGLSDTGLAAGIGSALGMGAFFSMGGMLKGGSGERVGPAGTVQGVVPAADYPGPPNGGPAQILGRGSPGIVGSTIRGAAQYGVIGTAALAGSMLSGAAAGDSRPGLEAGLKLGGAVASNITGAGSSIKSFVSEAKEKGFAGATGIVDNSMLMDPGFTASLARRALGDNAVGGAAAGTAATASKLAYMVAPVAAPEARERLDSVTAAVGPENQDNKGDTARPGALGAEFEKVRQTQHFRQMFSRIQNCRHSGGSGGIYGSSWR